MYCVSALDINTCWFGGYIKLLIATKLMLNIDMSFDNFVLAVIIFEFMINGGEYCDFTFIWFSHKCYGINMTKEFPKRGFKTKEKIIERDILGLDPGRLRQNFFVLTSNR